METLRRNTKKRSAILECIQGTTCHPTADWVYTQLKPDWPELSLGTVYRNLNVLRQQGEIISVGFNGGMEHFDGDLHPHAHFFCSVCGRVTDLMEAPLPQPVDCDGRVDAVALTYHGTCGSCLARERMEKSKL